MFDQVKSWQQQRAGMLTVLKARPRPRTNNGLGLVSLGLIVQGLVSLGLGLSHRGLT